MSLLTLRLLADCPATIPVLADWFVAEWPGWYGPGGPGDAHADLHAYAGRNALPIGVVAFHAQTPVGFAALKAESISVRPQFGPWAAAGIVRPDCRRRGYGAQLLGALEVLARARGAPALYCGTATAATLLERCGWELLEAFLYHDAPLRLYRKLL